MQMIRHYAVPGNQVVEVTVPEAFIGKSVEIQVILIEADADTSPETVPPPKKGGLGHLVGSLSHLTPEQNAKIDRELTELRDSWERDIF